MIPAIITHIEYSPSKEVALVTCKPQAVFPFKEWQFMMISSSHIHSELWKPLKKPYSIATTNEQLQTDWTIWFVVKKVRDGFMSDYLTRQAIVWDILYLQWPVWHMVDKNISGRYLLISTWSGLSPITSLYTALRKNPQNKIANLFGERYHAHVLPSVEKLFSENTDHIYHQLFLSKQEWLSSSWIQPKSAKYSLWRMQGWLDNALAFLWTTDISVFICGKPEMVDDVRKILTEKWVDTSRIQFEKY